MPVRLREGEPERERRVALPARERLDSRPDLLADAGRGEEAEAKHGGEELLQPGIDLLEPLTAGNDLGNDEVPDEELHEERHVAEHFHVGARDGAQRAARYGPEHAEQRTEDERDGPGARGEQDGGAQPLQEPAEIRRLARRHGLQENVEIQGTHGGAATPGPCRWVT